MTQGFDEFKKEFGVNYSQYSAEHYIIESSFNAGAASRQAEINSINRDLNHAFATVELQGAEIDELQKRIDKALYKLPWLNWKNIDGKMKGEIMDILKGKKDE